MNSAGLTAMSLNQADETSLVTWFPDGPRVLGEAREELELSSNRLIRAVALALRRTSVGSQIAS